jgi:MOSC domain-containing protein
MAAVTELYTYPVKGCARVPLAGATLTEAGLAHDRTFMVISPDGEFRSQRRDRRLAVIQPEVSTDGTRLTLRAPGMDALGIDVDLTAPRREVVMFGTPYRGIDQGDRAAAWLTAVLGSPSRLVRVPPEHDRVTIGWINGTAGYADSGAVLVIAAASLRELNRRAGDAAVPMSRFRPNVVIDGWDRPHREDEARRITIGDGELGYAKLDIRCMVTLVDQDTGAKAGPEPLRTLASYRRSAAGGVAFGAKFSVLRPGKLTRGDEVIVTAWGDPEL